jgi:hypothetical protein
MSTEQWKNYSHSEELRVILYREQREYKGLTEDDRDPTWKDFTREMDPGDRYSPNYFPCYLCKKFHNRHPSIRLCEYANDKDRLVKEQRNFPPTIARIIYLNSPDLLNKAIITNMNGVSIPGIRWYNPDKPTHNNPDHLSMMIKLGRVELIEVLINHNCLKSLSSNQALYYVKIARNNNNKLGQYLKDTSGWYPNDRKREYDNASKILSMLETEFKHYIDADECKYNKWLADVEHAWAIDEPSR